MKYIVTVNDVREEYTNPIGAFNRLRSATVAARPGEPYPTLHVENAAPGQLADLDKDYIIIERARPGFNRFKEAYDVQNACNPSGVARLLPVIMADVQRGKEYNGTDDLCSDPAIVAVIDKLNSMMRADAFDALRECRERMEPKPPRRELALTRGLALCPVCDGYHSDVPCPNI